MAVLALLAFRKTNNTAVPVSRLPCLPSCLQKGLVCFRDGALVGSADLGMFLTVGDGGLQEELATSWLRGRRALQQAGPPEGAAQREAQSSDEVGAGGCVLGMRGRAMLV